MRIQVVCGFGCGTSLFLKIKLDEVLREMGRSADVFCGDVGTCLSHNCDAIFISEDLSERVIDRAKMPVVVINNFMDKNEVREKAQEFYKKLEEN
jgi:PTS system ascorbate-specific IIB component